MSKDHLISTIIIISVSSFCFSCANQGNDNLQKNNDVSLHSDQVHDMIDSKENYSIVASPDKQYALLIENVDTNKIIKFFIVNSINDSIIFADKLIDGEVRWISTNEIEVIEFPGIVQKKIDSIRPKYIYNISTKTKIKP